MSSFIAIAFSDQVKDPSRDFSDKIKLKDISRSPFGEAVLGGKRETYKAFLVTLYGDSSELLDKGYPKENQSRLAIDCINKLLMKSPTVAFCFHWFRGDVNSEKVSLQGKEVLSFQNFRDLYPHVQEDVLYVIIPKDL